MREDCRPAIGLALVMALTLWSRVSVAGPPEGDPDQDGSQWVGLTSTGVECLAVRAGTPDSASATVRLEWEGQVEEAFLVLSVAGSRGGHSIYVNGQRVGSAPVRPGGQPCQAVSSMGIPIPPEVLVEGENMITLTNDANVNDGWTAASLYLEIHGVLGLVPATLPESPSPVLFPSEMRATAVVTDSELLTSSYDGVGHRLWYQVPDGYTGSSPVPLLIGVHGWGGTGEDMLDFMGDAVNERGWLFAAPNMHGRYYIDGSRALAWPGAQHDIVDSVEYMMSNYNVDTSRIYVMGPSMGGQTTTVMATKYPDVFAAAAEWSGFTDLADWYSELDVLGESYMLRQMRREIDPSCDPVSDPVCGTPGEEPFEYQRRSAIEMPQNSRLIPLHMWHNEADELVPVHHSYDLAYEINSWDPLEPVTVTTVITAGCTDTHKHCYRPDFDEVFDYLASFTLSQQPPLSLTIHTDESKPYYWLNFAQTGGDHWSEVEATCSLADKTVTAAISDIQPLTLAFNLGSTTITGTAGIGQPGIGLPATMYLVSGGGNYELENYTSGYLTTTLATTGQFTLTISAIEAQVMANPAMVSGWQTATSTITAVFKDHLNNPVPNDTTVQISTSEGIFPNAGSAFTATTTGGQVTTTLTLTPTADLAEIIAGVGSITGSTSVAVVYPAIDVLVTPLQAIIYGGQAVTYTYQITNTGDVTLTDVTVLDDNSTVCEGITLTAGAAQSCVQRSPVLSQTTTTTATVTGRDPLGSDVIDSDLTTVSVISPAIDVLIMPSQAIIYGGQAVTYTYQITNTGDVTLTGVTVVDDNGTVCEDITLTAGAVQSCVQRGPVLSQTTTTTAAVTGQDPLGSDVTDSDLTTVSVISPAIDLLLTPHQTTIYVGEFVTYTYQVTNTGDITLTGVTVVDDNSTVCEDITLTAGAAQSCVQRSPVLSQTTAITATVTGQDPLGHDVADSYSTTVVVKPRDVKIYLPIVTRSG